MDTNKQEEFDAVKAEEVLKETPEEAKKRKAEELETAKIRHEQEQRMKNQIAQRKKFLTQELSLLRLEHEYIKLMVEYHEYTAAYSHMKHEQEKAMQEEMDKRKAAEKAKETGKKKIITMNKELVDSEGNSIKT